MIKESEAVLEYGNNVDAELIKLDGLDDCLIGVCNTFDGLVLLYDENKIIEQLSKEMTEDEAWEYYEYNILGAYFGKCSPIFKVDIT
jgi:hypothetical protein